ncbi:uncharacterized protein LOC130734322 isoform X2 [Lotus japonicus]|uniref:uncharacterized protein LOC130734322 isoform X2 n=1 Tax=Lotus japonicus TaxID=34305 RepID=UPI00258BB006|nr:uncharacterized protein LOC130734322 isoform X2 [Lotus japonicus]
MSSVFLRSVEIDQAVVGIFILPSRIHHFCRPFDMIFHHGFGYFICHLKAMRASEAASTIERQVVNPLNESHGFDAALSMWRVPNLDYVAFLWCSTPQHIDYGGESLRMEVNVSRLFFAECRW